LRGDDSRVIILKEKNTIRMSRGKGKEKMHCSLKFPKKSRFLIITAHPDDETIFCGGLLSRFNNNSFVLCATHGLGFAKNTRKREEIKMIREKEFKNALKTLGVKFRILEEIDKLNYHSLLKRFGAKETFNRITSILKPVIKEFVIKFEPDFIVTHNSFGEYGHFLHKSIHKIVYKAFKEIKSQSDGFKDLKLLTFAPELRIRSIHTNRMLKTRHKGIDCRLILSNKEFNRKLSALRCYASQESIFDTNKKEDFRIENYSLVK